MPTCSTAISFLKNIGFNTHLGWMPTYTDMTKVLDCLAYAGITNIRDYAPAADNSNINDGWAAAAAAGIRFCCNIDQAANITDYIARVNNFITQYPGVVKYVEGPNEIFGWPTTYGGQTGMAAGILVQQDLYAASKANSLTSTVPVLLLTTGGGTKAQTYDLLGNLSAYADYGNAHVYPQDTDPTPYNYTLGTIAYETSVTTPSLATVTTETGYYTMPDNNHGVNIDIQARYMLNLVLSSSLQGVKSTYLYELLDDVADPGNTTVESHFGVFYTDGTHKPAATALHNLTTILADTGSATTGAGLAYSVSGMPAAGHHMQLVKATGLVDIIVWAEPNIWNNATSTQSAPSSSSVTVSLGATYASVSIYDPMIGTSPTSTLANVSSVVLSVTDHPLIVAVGSSSGSGGSLKHRRRRR